MIITVVFVLLQIFSVANISWWWILLALYIDTIIPDIKN